MGQRAAERTIGILFILAFPFFAGGQYLLSQSQMLPGFGLVLLNSVSVLFIGILMSRIIRPAHSGVATAYLSVRVLEAVLLAAGSGYFAFADGEWAGLANLSAYRLAMIGLSAGSIFMFIWLLRSRWVPQPLSMFGIVGYACLGLAMTLDASGFEAYSMGPLLIGAAFELVFAGCMIFRGFRAPAVV